MLASYVVFPSPEAADAATLYAAATHAADELEFVPAGDQVPGEAVREVPAA